MSDVILDLAAIKARAEAATPGTWAVGKHDLHIYASSEKLDDDTNKIFDVRGWGYFTGQGHGALGLSFEEGRARQAANGAHVAGMAPPTTLALVAEVERLRARVAELESPTPPLGWRRGMGSLSRIITEAQANAAWDILVEYAHAYDDGRGGSRYAFVHAQTKDQHPCEEYRFCGSLGFGGKFRNNGNNGGVPYVDCYRENETPERLATIAKVNGLLAELFAEEPRPCG